MAHTLGNHLSALQLRVQVLAQDPTCKWAQPRTLLAVEELTREASAALRSLLAMIERDRPDHGDAVTSRMVASKRSKSTGFVR
jgi:hypothetical protein